MSKIVISGASGELGQRITKNVREKIPASDLTLVSRNPSALASSASDGVKICYGDYRDLASLEAGYEGSDVLMIISGHAVAKRIPEHRNAIASAKKAGIKHIVYTSVAGVHPRNPTISAGDHIVTENDLRESGLGYTILRNQTYCELFTAMAEPALMSGTWFQVSDGGMIAPVSREDIARCAATCLVEPERHANVTYEITGPDLLTFKDIAAMVAELYDIPIEYVVVSPEKMYEIFDSWGFQRTNTEGSTHPGKLWGSDELVTAYTAFAQDYHAILSHHVQFITGSRPASLRDILVADKPH